MMISRVFYSSPKAPLTFFCLLSALAAGVVGCSQPKPSSQQAQGSATFGDFAKQAPDVMATPRAAPQSPASKSKSKVDAPVAAPWSIVIVAADETNLDAARMALEKVRTTGGLPDAYLEKRGDRVVVAYGRYDSPMNNTAQRDLQRIQSMEIDGSKPFMGAVLTPPEYSMLSGSVPEYNLAFVKQQRPKALYTLQVAVYERSDGKPPTPRELAEIRSSAEKAAVQLRREGDEAFYYHGPNRSMVTVAVFLEEDVDPARPGVETFAVTALRKKHPLNLVNGQGVKVKVRGQAQAKLQPSFIVAIPKS
jgi:hypothetical protein